MTPPPPNLVQGAVSVRFAQLSVGETFAAIVRYVTCSSFLDNHILYTSLCNLAAYIHDKSRIGVVGYDPERLFIQSVTSNPKIILSQWLSTEKFL